ncbi:GNAT family N-acetyltransferase [Teichococcus globiformis]|uniref:GNAT family N-acetyltransferase n=1 Tax=Teichococcus globiformis TaxID=2307229 RepID=UPI0036D2E554
MPDIAPRLAMAGEAPLLAALVERAYAPWVSVVGRRPAPMQDDYVARIAASQAWVAEDGGGLAALAVVEERRDAAPPCLLLDNIAVEPDRHGTGLGLAMLRFVGQEALRRGLPEVRLYTNEKMERNIALYARLGFTEAERRQEGAFRRVIMAIPSEKLAG